MKGIIFFLVLFIPFFSFSQRVGVNTASPSGALDINATEPNVPALKINSPNGAGIDLNMLDGANTGIGLRINSKGTGRMIDINSTSSSTSNHLAFLNYNGLGRALELQSNNLNNNQIAFYLNNSGTNHAMQIQNSNPLNTSTVSEIFHLGNGQVLDLQNSNPANTRTTLNVRNNTTTTNTSIGYAIRAETKGSRASYFVNNVGDINSCAIYGRNESPNMVALPASAGIIGSDGGFAGNVAIYAFGDIVGSSKSFMIDHPVDPANKFLKHFSIESDEALLIYRGQAVLDTEGKAVIQLKDYQKAIIKNVTYNLTAISSPTIFYVEKELTDAGQFVVAGNNPGAKVNWTLYAERDDAYFKAYPSKKIIEIEKPAKVKGRYLNPVAHGKSKSLGIDQESPEYIPEDKN